MEMKVMLDTVWVMIAGMLVFFMNLGFAMLEAGFVRAKNCVNILAKNFVVFAIASIAFLVFGWGLMFGDGNGFVGHKGLFFLSGADNSPATGESYNGVYSALSWATIPLFAKFFFQLVFCGTAATIVSGAVAERIRFKSFVFFSFLMAGLLYPIAGHWIWGGGWLQKLGMLDFAGSTVVHSVGGWAALAGVLILGPRFGKYTKNHTINPIPGHSMALATIGTFVLWFGWFGFNPGSTLSADPPAIARIAMVTNTSAAAATLTAMLTSMLIIRKPDFGMTLNGCLAGLVAITAPCAFVGPASALLIGAIAGVLVVVAVIAFDRIRVDDPVGALSVHLVNGIFGTLCVGLFARGDLVPPGSNVGLFFGGGTGLLKTQLLGVLAVGGFVFGVGLLSWSLIRSTVGMRVPLREEIEGLDVIEHGASAYPEFQHRRPNYVL